MINRLIPLFFVCLLFIQCKREQEKTIEMLPITDYHAHIMSPTLVEQFKAYEIPFTHNAPYYTNIDSILANNNVKELHLISMGYIWNNPDFYPKEDGLEKLQAENDFTFAAYEKHPERVKPYFGIHPLQEKALAEIDRCVAKGFYGVKMHGNSSQIYLTEPEHLAKVKDVFTKIAEAELPFLLHFDNGHRLTGKRDVDLLMDSVLINLPAMHINIAHMGSSGGFSQKTQDIVRAFSEAQNAGMGFQHTIKFDVSAVGLLEESEGVPALTQEDWQSFSALIKEVGIEHFVFGSDYPLTTASDYKKTLMKKLSLDSLKLVELMNN